MIKILKLFIMEIINNMKMGKNENTSFQNFRVKPKENSGKKMYSLKHTKIYIYIASNRY